MTCKDYHRTATSKNRHPGRSEGPVEQQHARKAGLIKAMNPGWADLNWDR
jgi:hypothetical protein